MPLAMAAQSSTLGPLSWPSAHVTASTGSQDAPVAGTGRTPCCAGMMQVHFTLPGRPAGHYLLVISAGGRSSAAATITVARR